MGFLFPMEVELGSDKTRVRIDPKDHGQWDCLIGFKRRYAIESFRLAVRMSRILSFLYENLNNGMFNRWVSLREARVCYPIETASWTGLYDRSITGEAIYLKNAYDRCCFWDPVHIENFHDIINIDLNNWPIHTCKDILIFSHPRRWSENKPQEGKTLLIPIYQIYSYGFDSRKFDQREIALFCEKTLYQLLDKHLSLHYTYWKNVIGKSLFGGQVNLSNFNELLKAIQLEINLRAREFILCRGRISGDDFGSLTNVELLALIVATEMVHSEYRLGWDQIERLWGCSVFCAADEYEWFPKQLRETSFPPCPTPPPEAPYYQDDGD